jgi:hypothetical protein
MAMENVAQEHITIEEEEAIVINWWTDGSNSDGSKNNGSPRSWHSPEDALGHLLEKRRAQKGSDDHDPDYIPEQQEVW